ncbi:MAG: hypothetical protein IPI31_10955 [Bacteroidetes bacterium]|nr:hypothetical protein [Bacteroidota bacterium]
MAVESYTHAVDLDPDGEVWVYTKLAGAEGNMGMYDEALEHIILFLSNPEVTGDPRIKANRLKTNFTFAKAAVLNPVDFNPVNMGDAINSEFPEYFPSLSVDGSGICYDEKNSRSSSRYRPSKSQCRPGRFLYLLF